MQYKVVHLSICIACNTR